MTDSVVSLDRSSCSSSSIEFVSEECAILSETSTCSRSHSVKVQSNPEAELPAVIITNSCSRDNGEEELSHRAPNKPPTRISRQIFRAAGLELLISIFQKSSSEESPKPVVSKSLRIALGRVAVHVVPCLVSIVLVTLNLNHLFIGRNLQGSLEWNAVSAALIQLASKIQELMMVSSLTTVVLHALRHDLVDGAGVPLGALGSGFMFSSLSYFWSPEFWGSIRSNKSKKAKARFYSILILCGIVALLAGPSTAVLMIPRVQAWPAGGADVYLVGSEESLRPTQLPSQNSQLQLCFQQNATDYSVCPSGGYRAMLDLARTRFRTPDLGPVQANATWASAVHDDHVTIPNQFELLPETTIVYNFRPLVCQTGAIGTSYMETMLLNQLQKDWFQVVSAIPYNPRTSGVSAYKYLAGFQIQTEAKIPAVKVICSAAQNISTEQGDVVFPVMPIVGCCSDQKSIDVSKISFKVTSNSYVSWIALPQSFGNVSTGVLFELPTRGYGGSRLVNACTIAAGWTTGTVVNYDWDPPAFSSETQGPFPWGQSSADGYSPDTDVDILWQRINTTFDWLKILSPLAPDSRPESPVTTLDTILQRAGLTDSTEVSGLSATDTWNQVSVGGYNRTVSLERILAHLFADGLSREGSTAVLNTSLAIDSWTLKDYQQNSDFATRLLSQNQALVPPDTSSYVTRTATVTITGLTFKATQITDFAAICLLLVYLMIAISHSLILVISRTSSESWDTFTEMLILAQNSPPALTLLKNTSAGVRTMKAYAYMARVRAVPSTLEAQQLRAEIHFVEELKNHDEKMVQLSPSQQSKASSMQSSPAERQPFSNEGEAIEIDVLYG